MEYDGAQAHWNNEIVWSYHPTRCKYIQNNTEGIEINYVLLILIQHNEYKINLIWVVGICKFCTGFIFYRLYYCYDFVYGTRIKKCCFVHCLNLIHYPNPQTYRTAWCLWHWQTQSTVYIIVSTTIPQTNRSVFKVFDTITHTARAPHTISETEFFFSFSQTLFSAQVCRTLRVANVIGLPAKKACDRGEINFKYATPRELSACGTFGFCTWWCVWWARAARDFLRANWLNKFYGVPGNVLLDNMWGRMWGVDLNGAWI